MRVNGKDNQFFDFVSDNISNGAYSGEKVKADIASQILISRVARGMNQKEFAQFMGVSQSMISKWESGDCNFSLTTISEICDKLDLVFDMVIIKANEYQISRIETGGFEVIKNDTPNAQSCKPVPWTIIRAA